MLLQTPSAWRTNQTMEVAQFRKRSVRSTAQQSAAISDSLQDTCTQPTVSSQTQIASADVQEAISSGNSLKDEARSTIKRLKRLEKDTLEDTFFHRTLLDNNQADGDSLRISRPLSSSSSEDEQDKGVHEKMAFIKTLQKMRVGTRGVNTTKFLKDDDLHEDEEYEDEEVHYGLLDKQFTNKADPLQVQRDKHLEEFLAQHLSSNKNESREPETSAINREHELYKIPEHLKVKDTVSGYADKMNWVTGLVEVPISLDVKLKNIEATERAKRNLLKLGKVNNSLEEMNTTDQIVRTAFGSRFQNTEADRTRGSNATDDAALDRFRRHYTR